MSGVGACKLTGGQGEFVKAHILPKALTYPAAPGLPLIQRSGPHKPVRRWTSWYDDHLVCAPGERILRDLDTWAVQELRKHRLVWSGWGSATALEDPLHFAMTDALHWGGRTVKGADPSKLRLFFMSMLWRAAATDLPEFDEVEVPHEDLEKIRQLLVTNDPGSLSFYPAQLTQLSTLGRIHNLTPLAETKSIPSLDGTGGKEVPFFRFYFDGLVVHIHRPSGYQDDLGNLTVGNSTELTVSTLPYEGSFQQENLETLAAEAMKAWPAEMRALDPPPSDLGPPLNRRQGRAQRSNAKRV